MIENRKTVLTRETIGFLLRVEKGVQKILLIPFRKKERKKNRVDIRVQPFLGNPIYPPPSGKIL